MINTTLCGDWAGSAYSSDPSCPGTCAQRVADPSNFDSELAFAFLTFFLSPVEFCVPGNTRLIAVIVPGHQLRSGRSALSSSTSKTLQRSAVVPHIACRPYFAPAPTCPSLFSIRQDVSIDDSCHFDGSRTPTLLHNFVSDVSFTPKGKGRRNVALVARSFFFLGSWPFRFTLVPCTTLSSSIAVYIFFCCICTNVLSFNLFLYCLRSSMSFLSLFIFGAGRACRTGISRAGCCRL